MEWYVASQPPNCFYFDRKFGISKHLFNKIVGKTALLRPELSHIHFQGYKIVYERKVFILLKSIRILFSTLQLDLPLHTNFHNLDQISRSRRQKDEIDSYIVLTSSYFINFKLCMIVMVMRMIIYKASDQCFLRGNNWCRHLP